MIDPHEIEKKQFSTTRIKEGYDPKEVDDFLDRVAEAMQQLIVERNIAIDETARLRASSTQQLPAFQDAARLLSVAQRTADEQIEEATGRAGELVAQAERQAEDILTAARDQAAAVLADANRHADEMIAQGHEKRHAMIGQLEVQREELDRKVADLLRAREMVAEQLRAALGAVEDSQ